jgi:CheY-like chemotaxis protein
MSDLPVRTTYLVADDSPVVAELVTELLVEAGVEVLGPAFDGLQALQLLAHTRPDGVVLDFDMPGANGLEVLRHIRATPALRDCVVIMLTSHDEPSLREACMEAGADHFFEKANDFGLLVDLIGARAAGQMASETGDDARRQSADKESDI